MTLQQIQEIMVKQINQEMKTIVEMLEMKIQIMVDQILMIQTTMDQTVEQLKYKVLKFM